MSVPQTPRLRPTAAGDFTPRSRGPPSSLSPLPLGCSLLPSALPGGLPSWTSIWHLPLALLPLRAAHLRTCARAASRGAIRPRGEQRRSLSHQSTGLAHRSLSLLPSHPQQYACVGESVSARLSAIAPSGRGTVRIPQRRLWSGVPYPPCRACPADSLACCLLAYSPSQSLITSLISPGIAF